MLSFDPVTDAWKNIQGVKSYKGRSLSKSTAEIRKKLESEISEWQQLDPKEFHTVEGFDALKQSIGDIRESTQYGTPERKVANEVYHAVRKSIVDQAPEYAKVMKGYETGSKHLRDVEKALSLGEKAAAETALRKLQAIVKNDVSSAYGQRGIFADELQAAGASGLKERMAGMQASSFVPRGLSSVVYPGAAAAATTASGGLSIPAVLAAGAATSPRLVSEAAHAGGRAARVSGVPLAARQVGKLPAEVSPSCLSTVTGSAGS